MSRLTDDQVIDALREAEERLASGSTTDPAVDQVNPSQQDVQRQPQLPEPREKLSLRQPQKSTASTKVSCYFINTAMLHRVRALQ